MQPENHDVLRNTNAGGLNNPRMVSQKLIFE